MSAAAAAAAAVAGKAASAPRAAAEVAVAVAPAAWADSSKQIDLVPPACRCYDPRRFVRKFRGDVRLRPARPADTRTRTPACPPPGGIFDLTSVLSDWDRHAAACPRVLALRFARLTRRRRSESLCVAGAARAVAEGTRHPRPALSGAANPHGHARPGQPRARPAPGP